MSMESGPTLSRDHIAIACTIGFAAVWGIYLYNKSKAVQRPPQASELRRSNAIRRRRSTTTAGESRQRRLAVPHPSRDNPHRVDEDQALERNGAVVAVDVNELLSGVELNVLNRGNDNTTDIFVAEDQGQYDQEERDGEEQRNREAENVTQFQGLVYAISKARNRNEGIIHRGVTCDNCDRMPIVGVRFHCSNCPDFDLCEDCEATDCHLRTHVFYKIKIPAPRGNKMTKVWYPGKPLEMPAELPLAENHRLQKETDLSHERIAGLYQQFTCLANTPWPEDPCHVGMAMNRIAFDKTFTPQTFARDRLPPSLVFESLFSFFDTDKNGKIGFEEFVTGWQLCESRLLPDRQHRVFKALDLNDDGYVTKSELLQFFRGYYEVNKSIMLGYMKVDREGEMPQRVHQHTTADDYAKSSRPLASFFVDWNPEMHQSEERDAINDKIMNRYGDLIPKAQSDSDSEHPGPSNVDGADHSDRKLYSEREEASDHSSTWQSVEELVGGTYGSHSVYVAINKALTELIDPIFSFHIDIDNALWKAFVGHVECEEILTGSRDAASLTVDPKNWSTTGRSKMSHRLRPFLGDPTLPQFRPKSDNAKYLKAFWDAQMEGSVREYLSEGDMAAERMRAIICSMDNGALGFEDFRTRVSEPLSRWMDGWLDIVMF